MPIVFILALLFLSSVALLFDNPILAEQIATYSFWLLIVGFILLAIRYIRFENHKNEVDIPQPQNVGRDTA